MVTKEVTVYHLEMLEPNGRVVPPPRSGITVSHILRPTVEYFRSIYDPVGEDYNWRRRRKMTREELEAIIHHPLNEFHVLYVDDEPAGFAELDRRQPDEIELVQFGLMPNFHGQGLGKWFLQYMIDKAWSYAPQRFWVHTCTLDHAAALPNHLNSGSTTFKQQVIQQQIG